MTEETLFQEALAKLPAERAALLDVTCAGNPELRAAVESLLAGERSPDRLCKTPLLTELLTEVDRRRCAGQHIVFTNGCFDIFHAGHVHCLHQARTHGDFLIVALNSDASVRRLKGEGRPMHQWNDRAAVLTAMECVDAVIAFEEDTPMKLIEAIRPHVLVKGGDYRLEQVVGREVVEAHGGRVVLAPLLAGLSTTRLMPQADK